MEKLKQIINNIKSPIKTEIDCSSWQEFYLKDILEIEGAGKEIINSLEYGDINLVSSGENNNGIVKKVKNSKKIFSKNKITLAKNGSVGVMFYQNQPFCATSDILVLNNKKLNTNVALFLKVIAEKQTKKFSWTDKINVPKYNDLKIFLPTKNNQPDWEYMDKFIENLRNKMQLGGVKVFEIIQNIKNNSRTTLNTNNYKQFIIQSIFRVLATKTRELTKYSNGNIPFVSGISVNNGVEKTVSTDEQLEKGNCITVSSLDCSCFYQKRDFIGRGHGVVQRLYNDKLNKNNALFIATIIKKLGKKYNYSNQCFKNKLEKEIIKLPVKNGEVDWEYMTNYIENIKAEIGLLEISKHTHTHIRKIITINFDTEKWQYFKLNEILYIKNAKNINSTKIKYSNNINDTPHITRQIENNAVKGYVKNFPQNKLNIGKCLCIDMFLNTTYQARDFLAVDHILVGRHKNINKNIALFLKVVIERNRNKFSYSNIFCEERSDFYIKLPTKNNQPDWEYMDKFIENIRNNMRL